VTRGNYSGGSTLIGYGAPRRYVDGTPDHKRRKNTPEELLRVAQTRIDMAISANRLAIEEFEETLRERSKGNETFQDRRAAEDIEAERDECIRRILKLIDERERVESLYTGWASALRRYSAEN